MSDEFVKEYESLGEKVREHYKLRGLTWDGLDGEFYRMQIIWMQLSDDERKGIIKAAKSRTKKLWRDV